MTTYAMDRARAFGYLKPAEVLCLQSLVGKLHSGDIVVNIGAGAGTSALAFLEANPHIDLFTIDINESGPLGGLDGERNAFLELGLSIRHKQILGDSIQVSQKWPAKNISLLFIDDCHEAGHVSQEIDAWITNVKDNGMILFHDYSSDVWREITAAIDVGMKGHGWRRLLVEDTVACFVKKRSIIKP